MLLYGSDAYCRLRMGVVCGYFSIFPTTTMITNYKPQPQPHSHSHPHPHPGGGSLTATAVFDVSNELRGGHLLPAEGTVRAEPPPAETAGGHHTTCTNRDAGWTTGSGRSSRCS
jgi:hypothetical protein